MRPSPSDPAVAQAACSQRPDPEQVAREEIDLLSEAMIASQAWSGRPSASDLDMLLGLPPR